MDVWEGMMTREFLYHLIVQKQILVSCALSLTSLSLNLPASQDFLTFPLSAALLLHILSNRFFFTFSATAVSSLSQEQQQKNFFSSSADDRSSADFLRSECCFILEELDPEPNASDHIP
jgi:hypothetical protein